MRTNYRVLAATLVLLNSGSALAYKVYTTNNSFSIADYGVSVNIMNVTEFGMKAESHLQLLPKVIPTSTTYTKSNVWQILPDVGMPAGEIIPVKFSIEHISNSTANNGCSSLFDNVGKLIFETCGVQNVEKEYLLKVGVKYRAETNAQSRHIGAGTISSYVSKVTWKLPVESGRYTVSVPPAPVTTECAVDDGNNGHGNDPGKVDPSNPGKSK